MAEERHVDIDTLAAFLLGALDGAALQRVEAHLAIGCVQCLHERNWLEQVLTLARSDHSVEPPSHVLARAVRIMAVKQVGMPTGDSVWRRLRALPIFDNLGALSVVGARGAGGATRQVLYAVESLHLEIALQVRHIEARHSLDVHGQVFPLDQTFSVGALPVMLLDAPDAMETLTSPLGAFHLEVPEDAALLVVHALDCAIEVPVPQP